MSTTSSPGRRPLGKPAGSQPASVVSRVFSAPGVVLAATALKQRAAPSEPLAVLPAAACTAYEVAGSAVFRRSISDSVPFLVAPVGSKAMFSFTPGTPLKEGVHEVRTREVLGSDRSLGAEEDLEESREARVS